MSDLEDEAINYAAKARATQSYQAAFCDGALYLLDVAKNSVDTVSFLNDQRHLGACDLVEILKSYCRDEGMK
jgi:hypothetical protein